MRRDWVRGNKGTGADREEEQRQEGQEKMRQEGRQRQEGQDEGTGGGQNRYN